MQSFGANTAPSLQILITGPSAKANAGLAGWLTEMDGIVVMGAETEVVKSLTMAYTQKPDVVLLDFETDDFAFLHTIQLFGKINPQPTIVVLVQKLTPIIRRRCTELGAELIFEKTNELDQVFDALQSFRRRRDFNALREK